MTGENKSNRRKSSPSANLSTETPMWPGLGLNRDLSEERRAADCLKHHTAISVERQKLISSSAGFRGEKRKEKKEKVGSLNQVII